MKHRLILFVLLLLLFSHTAFGDPPPSDNVGAQAERFRIGVGLRNKELAAKKITPPEIKAPEKKEAPAPAGPSFVLKKISITGSTVFTTDEFLSLYQSLYKSFIGKEITFKDLDGIAQLITAKYKQMGYLTTFAYVPEQSITDGRVEIRISEGKMGALKVEGNRWFSKPLISRFFHTKKNEVLNVKKLQRDILRLNLNPDLELKAVLAAGEAPETTDITLKATENFPVHFGTAVDDQGTRLTGKYRNSVFLRSTNTTGNMDTLNLNYIYSASSSGESLNYSIPVGTNGTKFGFDTTFFETKLGKEFTNQDITGVTQVYSPHMSWELALADDFQAYANVGMDIKSIIKKTGSVQTSDDQMRLPYIGFDFSKTHASGNQTSFSPQLTFSLDDFLGASSYKHPSASRAGTGGFFAKYTQSLSHIHHMPWESYISLRSQLQLASHTLPSSEQFQLGGANSVRGYAEGDYLADNGADLNIDWIFPMYFIPKQWSLAKSDIPLRYQVQPIVFIDTGGGWLEKTLVGERHQRFLAGVGAGLRIQLKKNLFLRLEWAKRIGDRPVASTGPSTFHITFQTEI